MSANYRLSGYGNFNQIIAGIRNYLSINMNNGNFADIIAG